MLIAYLVELLEDLLENMLIMFVLIAAVILIITALIVRFALERNAKAESIPIPEQLPVPQQIQASRNIGGTVTQIREIRSAVYGQTKNRYFELAVTYDAGNGMQTALIGVRTDGESLIWNEGDKVRLQVFAQPMLSVTPEDFIESANACGSLPKRNLHFREIGGIPTDETASVIFAADAKALETQLRNAMPQPAPVPVGKIAGDIAKEGGHMLLKDIIRNALK